MRRASFTGWAAAPWLVLASAVALTVALVSWRGAAVGSATDTALASAEGHFNDVVADHERRVSDVQRELELVLLGASMDHVHADELADIAGRLEQIGTSSLVGLRGFAVVETGSAVPVDGFGSGLDDDVLTGLSDIAVSSPSPESGPWVASLDVVNEPLVVVGRTIDESTSLVAAFDGEMFLLGGSAHTGHHVMASLVAGSGSSESVPGHRFSSSTDVVVFGETWTLNVQTMDGFLETPSSQEVRVVAILGALLSIMLFTLTNYLVKSRRRVEQRALHDELTGLPNRALLTDRITQALRRSRRTGTLTAAIFIDVDRFKHVNDTLGHTSGDVLLQQVANELRRSARESDTVARFGGDEFVVVCDDLRSPSEAIHLANRFREAIADPDVAGDRPIPITLSMGVAVGAANDDPEALLRDADLAMYQAKEDGRDRAVLFEREMRDSLLDRLALQDQLRGAIERDELRAHYQPILDLGTNSIVGFEALVRWQHPTRGLLGPAEFLASADETGILTDIDEWILETAATQLATWISELPDAAEWTMAVNASPANFGYRSYSSAVRETLARTGLSPNRLCIELTEEAVLSHAETAARVMADLRELGIQIAIDDFGTGYSSFSKLATLDFDLLKIDRSFTTSLDTDSGAEIIQAVIQMAQALGLTTVAEGVETEEELDRLRELGSDLVQGYLVARPMPPEDVLPTVAALDQGASLR